MLDWLSSTAAGSQARARKVRIVSILCSLVLMSLCTCSMGWHREVGTGRH